MKNNLKVAILVILVIIAALVCVLWYLNASKEKSNSKTISNVGHSWTDISYANASAAEKMDIYLPHKTGPYPVIIVIHGGGFSGGDKNCLLLQSIKQAAINRCYAVVSINYRLSDEAKFPAQINDVKAAIRYIRANAAKYNMDPDKIVVIGSSAGGHLASLAGTSGDVTELQDSSLGNSNVSDKVQAVVDLYGPINFITMDQQFKESGINGQTHSTISSQLSQLMGDDISLIPDQVAKANPETYISKDDPVFLIQHGSADNIIPYQQSVDLANKLKIIIGDEKVSLEIIQGAGHGDQQFGSTENIEKILNFLDTNLKQS